MEIRELAEADLSGLLDLYKHLHVVDEAIPNQGMVEAVWREALVNPRIKYFGVSAGCHLFSSCTLTVIPNLTRGCRPYGLIENVVTHQDHRSQGLGKAVLAHALDFAWKQDCYKVMLMTGRKDERTFHFYASAGFDRHEKQAFIAKRPGASS